MKVGDYVAKVVNDWQKHNEWMEFPDELPEPLGVIVAKGRSPTHVWEVLESCGKITSWRSQQLKVINGDR
jgi:hypothetical protein|tara:strand:+ start:6109 stop:6318 length:210 start_codon:yes stop_codon:yes gene_type:complete